MAARKQLTPAEVKAAKQKKIAIGGAVLLVAVLAFEVPKTLKMMSAKPPQVAAAAATTPAVDPAATPAATPAGAPAVAAPAGATGVDSLVVNADLSPAPLDGQLPAMTATFTSKDPFRQQLQTNPTTSGLSDETTQTPGTTTPAKPITSIVPNGPTGPTPTPTTPAAPVAAPVSAIISVNGVESAVGVASDFPASGPLFTLKSLTKKTAKIAIAGGSLSSGAPTITLQVGVPVTLMNTADGTRYRLVLVSTSTAAVAATAPSTSAPATTTQTTTTTG